MSEKIEGASTKLDGLKWLVVVAITVAAIYANSYFATESLLVRVVGLIIAAAIAGWIAIQTVRGRSFLELCLEARTDHRCRYRRLDCDPNRARTIVPRALPRGKDRDS